ncbi:MAG: 50S ribosomal protein L30 [Candidatus Marinimicrobia bacterium]|jgi:large subunit ribosomal protein L30|nr:50S ribosomal protein L30 [Candidatus Neomarinimicrobiota bacterium]
MPKKSSNKKLRITQIKSLIGHNKKFGKTLDALGIKKLNHMVEKEDIPSIRGMIRKIDFLLKVEEL